MKWFVNMKIATRLITGFILVALIAGVVGVVGIINILKTDGNYTELYNNFGVPIGDIGEVALKFQLARVNLRDMLLDKNSEVKQQYVDNVKTYEQAIEEQLSIVQSTLQTAEGKAAFSSLKAGIEAYKPFSDRVISYAVAGQEDIGLSILRSDGAKDAATQVSDSIDSLFKLKVEGGLERAGEYANATNETIIIMVVIVLAAMILALILGIFISRTISNPVKRLAGVAEKIASGDLDVEVDAQAKDEVGSLAASFRKMSVNLNEILSNISTAAEQVASGSRQVSDSSMALSQGATEQASAIEQLTASLEEVSVQTRQNADNANEANGISESAKTNAMQGNRQMGDMLKAMEDINDSSKNISKIIKVIDEIAFQTNILALNAAVEAARAGQHGKGFAVVAEEVRNLAARSANAAKETTEMIENSIKKVDGGMKMANQTAEALNRIVQDVAKVADLVGRITIASNEQASGISQINQGIMQVSQVVQTNSATSEETAAASEELSSQAEIMKDQASRFKLKLLRTRPSHTGEEDHDGMDHPGMKGSGSRSYDRASQRSYDNTSAPRQRKIILSDSELGKY